MPERVYDAPPADWLIRRFGSRSGLVTTLWHSLLRAAGRYRRYRDIDWGRTARIVFVCKGNICRSAFAEQVARRHGLTAVSCGLDTIDGAPADPQAVAAAGRCGIDLTSHHTTRMQSMEVRPDDLLVAMEPWQAEQLRANVSTSAQVTLLGLWGRGYSPHIQDPYGFHPEYFDHCFQRIIDSIDELHTQKIQ